MDLLHTRTLVVAIGLVVMASSGAASAGSIAAISLLNSIVTAKNHHPVQTNRTEQVAVAVKVPPIVPQVGEVPATPPPVTTTER